MNDPTIPCEICGELIPFTDYIQHLELCQHRSSVLNILNPMLNSFLQNHTDSFQINFDADTSNIDEFDSNNWRTVNLEDLMDTYEMNNIISEMIGNVNHGCVDIDSAISNVDINEIGNSNNRCSICLESLHEVASNAEVCVTTCDHYFCNPCITQWLREHRTCPLCNKDFNEE